MNIAFDAGAIEIAKGSGVGNYTLHQFKAMIESTPENNYYYFNTICKSELIKPLKEHSNFHEEYYFMGKDNVLREYDGQYSELYGQLVRNFIRKHEIDVFYITSPFLSENVMYQKEWFGNVKVVATAYDIIPYIMKEKYLPSKYLMKWYMSCIDMLRWCDRQLAISQSVKDDMVSYLNFDPEKIDIIYGGVSDKYCMQEYSYEDKKALFHRYGIKSKFIMCGISADQRKNIAAAIAAYALLPQNIKKEYQLVIVGRVLQESMLQYQDQITKLGEKGNVILTNYVSDDDLIKLYNFATLMLFPSLYEGFGLPLIEAWACGTPVAASNNSSLGELATGAGVLFDPNDVKDIARAITEALTTADLELLLENGRKKLSDFTWENVADLTLSSIKKACCNSAIETKDVRSKIACIFWDEALYFEGWNLFFEILNEYADVSVVKSKEVETNSNTLQYISYDQFVKSQKKFDDVFHFTSIQIDKEQGKKIKQHKGSLVLINEKILEMIHCLTKNERNDYVEILIAKDLKRYFDSTIDASNIFEYIPSFEKIVTFSDEQKQDIMQKSLDKQVINIASDFANADETTSDEIKAIAQNLIRTATIFKPLRNTKFWADKLVTEEIVQKKYTREEIRELANTLGMSVSTECEMLRYKVPVKSKDVSLKATNVDMVTTWNTKCGIAEFTKYFIQNTSDKVNYTIFPDVTASLISTDEENVAPRTWKQYDCNFSDLVTELEKSDSDIIHIQYNFGFFSLENVAKLITDLPSKKVIVDFHATKMISDALPKSTVKKTVNALNKAFQIIVHQQEDIKELTDVGIERNLICVIPLGQSVWMERSKEDCKKWLNIDSQHVIGSYGFMLPHKGVDKVIEAVAELKLDYPDILYIVSCALYNADVSKEYLLKCKQLAKTLGVEKNVVFINEFLKPEESAILLQACDMLAMVYSPTNESASGAIRFCMSAIRPIITTKQPIFDEYTDCTVQIASNDAKQIAQAARGLFEQSNEEYLRKIKDKIMETSWNVVGNKYFDLYNGTIR